MRIVTVGSEASVGALADRLYANLTPESRRVAVAALLRANPHLPAQGRLPAGAVVRVPAEGGLTVKAAEAGGNPVDDVLKNLSDTTSDYRKRLAEALGASRKDLEEQTALLKSREVVAALGRSPEAKQLATSLAASLTQRTKTQTEDEKRLAAVFDAVAKDIATMRTWGA